MKLEIIRGDDEQFELTFTDIDGDPIDLTDGTVFFTVKENLDDSDDDAVITQEVTSFDAPETGVATLVLTDEQTDIEAGQYFYDIQFIDENSLISSASRGKLYVYQDVTLRTN
jgi:hypothetical protein